MGLSFNNRNNKIYGSREQAFIQSHDNRRITPSNAAFLRSIGLTLVKNNVRKAGNISRSELR